MPASPLAVEARDLAKTFRSGWLRRRETAALRGASLQVPRGAIYGLLGPNGAGKTTLLSILATLLLPDSGSATILGHDVVREAFAIRRRLNMASGNASFVWSLRPAEVLAFYGRLYGLHGRALKAPRERAARALRADSAPQDRVQRALHRAQAAPGPGQGAPERSGGPLPRRADARPRSRRVHPHPGPDRGAAAGAEHHHHPDHPLHAGGRGALRRASPSSRAGASWPRARRTS